jgi:hypothetical protein
MSEPRTVVHDALSTTNGADSARAPERHTAENIYGTTPRNSAVATAADEQTIRDGRYHGGNHEIFVDLRIDQGLCGVISGDVFRRGMGTNHYVATFRTVPGRAIDLRAGSWQIVAQDEHARTATGRLTLGMHETPANALVGTLFFEGALEGLPSRRDIGFVAERVSDMLRSVGIELEVEENVAKPAAYVFNNRPITVEQALHDAGFETHTAGLLSRIPPKPDGGWDGGHLHTLMHDVAQASLLQRTWELHLMILSRSSKAGLLGVMFDTTEALPRQGAAVFAEEIRAIQGIDHDRKLIQTTVHELGHALNLAHRFERAVGRADSLSFMNYDWRFRGGNRSDQFWSSFAFTFDSDELEFLRHAPLPPLIPGGAPFHSVQYWADGNGGYSPYVPEAPMPQLALSLKVPDTGPLFAFAQPVFLEVALQNRTSEPLNIPRFLLDPKAGFLEMLIKRRTLGSGPGLTGAMSFTPVVQQCFEWDTAASDLVPPQQAISDSVNLTFGSGGFAFAEPGAYEVTAVLVIQDRDNERDFVVRSNTVQIRIAAPRTDEDEADALRLFRNDVGLYIALGGSDALGKASQILADVVRRRDPDDRLAAGLVRAQALDASREYIRYQNGKFGRQKARYKESAEMFERLEHAAKADAFDKAMVARTRKLNDHVRKQAGLAPRKS